MSNLENLDAPGIFHFYVMLVAHLLKYGDSNANKAAAYINARTDDSLTQNKKPTTKG